MSIDKNCLSYWFPILERAGLPVPRTEIVRYEHGREILSVLDGKKPTGWETLISQLKSAAERIGTPEIFFRTGQGSGKHSWSSTCCVRNANDLAQHVAELVEWSELVDMMGLASDVWVVREMLPTKPIATLPRYKGFSLVREVRAFIAGGDIVCHHPYWPDVAIEQGFGSQWEFGGRTFGDPPPANIEEIKQQASQFDRGPAAELATLAAKAFANDESFSLDLLETDRGWHITDMALASRSFHWEGCEKASLFS